MIQCLVFDLDGTLLTSQNKISPKTQKIIKKCHQAGIQICLCSGRDYQEILPYAKQLGIESSGYICAMNGAMIYDLFTQTQIESRAFTNDELHEIIAVAKQNKAHVLFAEKGYSYWYIPFISRFYSQLHAFFHPQANINHFKAFASQVKMIYHVNEIDQPFHKAIFSNKAKKLKKISHQLENTQTLSAFFSAKDILDIVPLGVSKGKALQTIMKQLQLQRDEVLGFGDSLNDLSFFQEITYSVAMGNAFEEVKAMAHDITDTNDQDGIVKMLEHYVQLGLLPQEIL